MRFLLKLVWRDLIRHKSLVLFTFLAIVATCCLIVWFVASIDMEAFADDDGTSSYYGRYSLSLCGKGVGDDKLISAVEGHKDVVRTAFAHQGEATMRLEDFEEGLIPSGMGDRRSPALLGFGDVKSPFKLTDGRWVRGAGECIVGTSAAKLLTAVPSTVTTSRHVVIGDKIRVVGKGGAEVLTVVGLFEQKDRRSFSRQGGNQTFSFGFGLGLGGGRMGDPGLVPPRGGRGMFGRGFMISPAAPSIYVTLETSRKLLGGEPNMLFVELSKRGLEDVFYGDLTKSLGRSLEESGVRANDPRPEVKADEQAKAEDTVISQAMSTIGIVLLASVFIIFTTLSLGVSEKHRYLALLRTIGFTRFQVALFVIVEGMLLGVLGWLGGIGSGWLLLTFLLYAQSGVFPVVTLSCKSLIFAFLCSVVGSLLASLIPAYRATRVPPVDAMPSRLRRFTNRRLISWGILGWLLLLLIPVVVFLVPMSSVMKIRVFTSVCTLCLGVGLLLVMPSLVLLTERVFGPLVSRLLGFHPMFMSQVLTGNQWRTIGTAIALSLGLGLFTAIHIWSSSMLTMFTVPDTIPDVLVRFQEGVISDYTTEHVSKMPGIREGHFMRVSVAQPDLGDELREKMLAMGAMGGNLVVMGVDSSTAWREVDPMIRLKFVSGNRESVSRAFSQPSARACVIPETLAVNGGLKLGSKVSLKASTDGRRPQQGQRGAQEGVGEEPSVYVDYEVVGIVDFAWAWMSKCSGVRVSSGRTSGLIFTPYDCPLKDFGAPDREFFWFDTDGSVKYHQIVEYMRKIAGEAFSRKPVARLMRSFAGGTRWDQGINKNFVLVNSNESLNNSLNSRAFSVIRMMARMPLVILVLSSLAIVNTMVVSVRSRHWELGVMRACGVTRWGLFRMIVAESLLVGLCTCLMSFFFGLFYAWNATGMVTVAPIFGVIAPPLSIPWAMLAPGYGLAVLLSVVAGGIPALMAGRKDIAELLARRQD